MNDLFPAFMFPRRLTESETVSLIGAAEKRGVELRYWQTGPAHLYVFRVPWNGQPSGNLGEAIYADLERVVAERFDLGYASDYEWEVYSQAVLYWPDETTSEEKNENRGEI